MHLAGNFLRAFAVHGILHVVPEFLDVPCKAFHIGHFLHVNNHVVLIEPLIRADPAQLAGLVVIPVHRCFAVAWCFQHPARRRVGHCAVTHQFQFPALLRVHHRHSHSGYILQKRLFIGFSLICTTVELWRHDEAFIELIRLQQQAVQGSTHVQC